MTDDDPPNIRITNELAVWEAAASHMLDQIDFTGWPGYETEEAPTVQDAARAIERQLIKEVAIRVVNEDLAAGRLTVPPTPAEWYRSCLGPWSDE